jgi:hypothetical protein
MMGSQYHTAIKNGCAARRGTAAAKAENGRREAHGPPETEGCDAPPERRSARASPERRRSVAGASPRGLANLGASREEREEVRERHLDTVRRRIRGSCRPPSLRLSVSVPDTLMAWGPCPTRCALPLSVRLLPAFWLCL